MAEADGSGGARLAVVKELNLTHISMEIMDTKLLTEHTCAIGGLLICDEQGAQREEYVELTRH